MTWHEIMEPLSFKMHLQISLLRQTILRLLGQHYQLSPLTLSFHSVLCPCTTKSNSQIPMVPKLSTAFKFGRIKRTRVGAGCHLDLTRLLSTANLEVKTDWCTELMVSLLSMELPFQPHDHTGHRIVQVRVVFEIPNRVIKEVFTAQNDPPPGHLAYVEWFSPIPITCGSNHNLYKVTRLTQNGQRHASIIPVASIFRSVHLFPIHTLRESNTFTVLEMCNSFYINPFSDRENYLLLS